LAIGQSKHTNFCAYLGYLDLAQITSFFYHNNQAPFTIVNCTALPAPVIFLQCYAFNDNRPDFVWNSCKRDMVEPNVDEQERAMGFQARITNVLDITEI